MVSLTTSIPFFVWVIEPSPYEAFKAAKSYFERALLEALEELLLALLEEVAWLVEVELVVTSGELLIAEEELVALRLQPVKNKGVARAIKDRYLFDFIIVRSFHLINLNICLFIEKNKKVPCFLQST